MKVFGSTVLGAALVCAGVTAQQPDAVIQRHCTRCHGEQKQRADLTLAAFDVANAHRDAEVAEKIVRKLRAGLMPPPGTRRPRNDALKALAAAIEQRIDAAAAADPNPGRRTFQRLNRAEYARSIRELLAIDVDVAALLPPDARSHGFDTIADVQTLSPATMECYLRAADRISRLAVGDPDAVPSETTYKVARTASQLRHVEGAPFGTRGGIAVVHNFPADGDYVFKIALHSGPTGFLFGMTARGERIDVSVDGARVALLDVDRWMSESDPAGMVVETPPVAVRAGPRLVAAAFLPTREGPVEDLLAPIEHTLADTMIGAAQGITTVPHLRDLVVSGPENVTGVSDTPSRRRIFTRRPTSPDEELECAREIVARLASRAYRRPLTNADVAGLMTFYAAGAAERGFESGVRTALRAVLASPHFVFRIERRSATAAPGHDHPIPDTALASRLSFFLWSTGPDAELSALAAQGRLGDAAVLERQVRRMLADPRAESLATRFAAQWLRLADLDRIHPDALAYPQFDRTLARSMRRETELFFEHLVRADRSVFELWTADYTFVDERLAKHYGIPNVVGSAFRRVALAGEHRRGVLGHGSVLTLTSHANRTSPVLRGKWVMEVLLGSPPPPPPPDVPEFDETAHVAEGRLLSVRERMEMHRANPSCRSCHRVIDPIGLALENFDVTGAWRIKDGGVPVDAAGELYDGTALDGPADLRHALLRRPETLVRNFIQNLMAYALGRRIEHFDMPAVRAIARTAAADDHRMSSIVLGVVQSAAFRMRRAEPAPAGPKTPFSKEAR